MRRFFVSLMLLVLLLTGALPAAAQDDACIAQGGLWDPDTERCVISAAIEITHIYPVVVADFPTADAQITQFFANERTRFLDGLAEYGFVPVPGPLVQEIDYEIVAHTEDIVTFVFTVYEYAGGAHGNTQIHTLHLRSGSGRGDLPATPVPAGREPSGDTGPAGA